MRLLKPLPALTVLVCALLYAPTRDALLRTVEWNFAKKQVSLTQLKSANDTNPTIAVPWQYEYAYPADCINIKNIIGPGNSQPAYGTPYTTGNISYGQTTLADAYPQFIVSSDVDSGGNPIKVVLTDQYQAICIYTARIENPDLWDAMFQDAMVATLAAKLVNPLARSAQLMVEQSKIAQAILKEAQAQNANEALPNYNSLPDWMQARGMRPPRSV